MFFRFTFLLFEHRKSCNIFEQVDNWLVTELNTQIKHSKNHIYKPSNRPSHPKLAH